MQKRLSLLLIIIFLLFFLLCNKAFACFSITDDLNFPNPTLNANFSLLPDISPLTDCWSGAIRIRSDKNNWRLVASRIGPTPVQVEGDPKDNVKAEDLTIEFTIKSFGMADENGAILVSPFSSKTDLSSVGSGSLIVSGIKKSGNTCSSSNPSYYRLTKDLCLFKDFVFNVGEYNGQVSYLLVSP